AVLGPEAAVAVSDIGLERLEGLLRNHHVAAAPPPPAIVEAPPTTVVEKPSKFDEELAGLDQLDSLLHTEREWRRAAAAVENVLTRRVEAQGGLPVVIDDALAGQPHQVVERAVARLAELAAAAQVVYLADGTEVADVAPPV